MHSPYCTLCRYFYQDLDGPVQISDGCSRVWDEDDLDSRGNIILNSHGECPGYISKELSEKDKEHYEQRDVYHVHGSYIRDCRVFFTQECMMEWLKDYLSSHVRRNCKLNIYFDMNTTILKGYDERTGHFFKIKEV